MGNVVDSITIRKCMLGDERILSLVGAGTFLESFAGVISGQDVISHCQIQHAVEKYRSWLESGSAEIWVAEIAPGHAPMGYVVLTTPDLPLEDVSSDDIEVKRIYVFHRFQGSGVGRRLMDAAKDHAVSIGKKRLLLGVYGGNDTAIAFYRRVGYEQVGTRTFTVGSHTYEDLVMGMSIG